MARACTPGRRAAATGEEATLGVAALQDPLRRRSARETIVSVGLRAADVAALRVLRAIAVSRVSPAFLDVDPRYEHGFLDEAALRRFARDEVYDLSDRFLDEALARGDRCYAIVDGERLASFGWYARRPTPIDRGLYLRFDPRLVYMYKGFTHRDYRGRRLHAIGMTRALSEVLSEGASGIVSYVDSKNRSSLVSCYRMGYEDVGRIYVARVFDRAFAYADAACRARGVDVTRGA
jgi:hypothetical protein